MNNFFFLFFFLNFYLIKGRPYEECLKFPIHFNLYECTYVPIRRWIPPMTKCPNLGTWDCASFKCFWPDPAGFCRHGEIDYGECCTFKEIHYVDMWFEPNTNCDIDWKLDIFNLEINGNGNDICIENGDTTCFFDVFHNIGKKTFLSVTLEYNETCVTNMNLYVNGSFILNVTGHDLDLFIDLFFTTIIRQMVEIDNEGYNEKLYFVSAHTIIPTPDQIMELYLLGSNRSPDTEICFNLTSSELDECHETVAILQGTMGILEENLKYCQNMTEVLNGTLMELYEQLMNYQDIYNTYKNYVPPFWMILAIVLMGILIIIFVVFFIWLMYTLFRRRSIPKIPTNSNFENKELGENVFF